MPNPHKRVTTLTKFDKLNKKFEETNKNLSMIVDKGTFADQQNLVSIEVMNQQASISMESQFLEDEEYNQQVPGRWGNPKLEPTDSTS